MSTYEEEQEPNRGAVGARELAECEEHARAEVVREVFDRLEERIVQYHTNMKAQIALQLARLERANNPEEYAHIAIEVRRMKRTANGVEFLAHHIGYVSETEFHGIHRRRLETLTVEDLATPRPL